MTSPMQSQNNPLGLSQRPVPRQTEFLKYERVDNRFITRKARIPLKQALKEASEARAERKQLEKQGLWLKRQIEARLAKQMEVEAFQQSLKRAKAFVEADCEETTMPIDLKAEIKRIIDKASASKQTAI